MSCAVGCRHGSDSALLWLWGRPAAVALIQPLAWVRPYAMGVALKRQKKKKRIQLQQLRSVEAQVRFQAQRSALKDLALLQVQSRSQLRLGLDPWSRNFLVLWVWP